MIVSRRRALRILFGAGGVLALGLVAACAGPGASPTPAPKREPTLVPTALPTAAPAGAPTPAGTPAVAATATAAPVQAAPAVPRGGTLAAALTILEADALSSLDPHRAASEADRHVAAALFDTLTFRNDDQSVIRPMLATSWRVQHRRWELKLRPDVRFHNGDALTAADVAFSIARARDLVGGTSAAALLATIERIETPDPLTITFITQRPDPLLPARLACTGTEIVSKRHVEQVGSDGPGRQPMGTGPYRVAARTADGPLVVERFEGYWGGAPAFARVTFRAESDAGARLNALLAGAAELVVGLSAEQIARVQQSGRARVEGVLVNGLHVLAVNTRVPPLDRPLVRQALSLATDRETLARSVYHGQGVTPNGLIAQGEFGFDATLPPLEHNLHRARQRLQAAGYDGEQIVLETTRGAIPGDLQMAELLLRMWRTVGVNGRLEVIDAAAMAAKQRGGAFKGLWWSEPTSPLLDPDSMMYERLASDRAAGSWRDAEWERLGEEARHSLDQELRLRSYRRMNEIALEQLPWIPVLQPRRLYGASEALDFRAYGTGYLNLRRENLRPRS